MQYTDTYALTMDDLLMKRDKEFSKIDAELDLKANILMKEAENLMVYYNLYTVCV
jgi:hypothetical protein